LDGTLLRSDGTLSEFSRRGLNRLLDAGVTGNDPVISTWNGVRDGVHFGSRTNDSTTWYVEEKRKHRDPRLLPCEDLLAIVREESVAQITTFALDEEAVALVERLREAVGYEVVRSNDEDGIVRHLLGRHSLS